MPNDILPDSTPPNNSTNSRGEVDEQSCLDGDAEARVVHGEDDDASNTSTSIPPGGITVHLGSDRRHIDTSELANDEYYAELLEWCESLGELPVFHLDYLLELSDDERWSLLQLITCVQAQFTTEKDGQPQQFVTLLDCVLSLLVGDDDITRCGRGRRAAIETAVLKHPRELQEACSKITKRLQHLKLKNVRAADIYDEAERLSSDLNATVEEEEDQLDGSYDIGRSVLDTLENAPVGEAIEVPPGWEMDDTGVQQIKGDNSNVLFPCPILVNAFFKDDQAGEERVCIAWYRHDRWHSAIIKRSEIANTRLIVELSDKGLPVTSNNARDLVQWLGEFENHNVEAIPRSYSSHQLGWQGDQGSRGFLLGDRLVDESGNIVHVSNEDQTASSLVFHAADEGDQQLADGFATAGSMEEWRECVALAAPYPRVLLAVYCALVPPLMGVFRVSNFLVDLCGPTSTGKTSALRVAASIWGNPDENSPAAAISTWDGTRRWFERAMGVLNYLPFVCDDTKRANDDDVGSIIYDVASGRGRGRATTVGTQQTSTFNTVMLLSGEGPATSFTQAGGAKARVLTIWGTPFGQADQETGQVVQALTNGILNNYGHAGPAFVQFLIRNREHWPEWKQQYDEHTANYQNQASDNSVARRMASTFAAIRMAAQLAHECLDLPWAYEDPIEPVWHELTGEANEADRAKAALHYIYEYASSNQASFIQGKSDATSHEPLRGWLGRWDISACTAGKDGCLYDFIAFLPTKLREILTQAGFDSEAILRTWNDRGWLKKERSSNSSRPKIRLAKSSVRMVAISREAIESLDGPAPQEEGAEDDTDIEFADVDDYEDEADELRPILEMPSQQTKATEEGDCA